jgi:cytoskeleton-associated protein 5
VQVTKGYVSALLETLADPEGGVREASAEALATLFKFLGEAKVMPFMPDLDNLKLEKIKVSQWKETRTQSRGPGLPICLI